MTRLVHSTRPRLHLDRALTTVHTFGSLAIALYDGRLLAVALATPDCAVNAQQRRAADGHVMKRPVISWAGGA